MKEIKAWETSDALLFKYEKTAAEWERELNFKAWYAKNELDSFYTMDYDDVFCWLKKNFEVLKKLVDDEIETG